MVRTLLITKIASFGIIITIIIILLRHENHEYATILSLMSGIFIFYLIIPQLNNVFIELKNISQNFSAHSLYLAILFKIIGIAYICEFSSQICMDAGEKAIAGKIELSGKILIMATSIPILNDLLETILNMI